MTDEMDLGGNDEDSPEIKEKNRLAAELRLSKKTNRELQERLAELEAKKHDEDLGIGDDAPESSRRLAKKLLSVEAQLSEIQRLTFRTEEDVELEPYLEKVLDDHPELLKAYPTPGRRVEAARVMARGLQAQDTDTRSSQGRKDTIPRVHLSGSGSPAPRSRSDSGNWREKMKQDMAKAKNADERYAIALKYENEHPDE